MKNFDEFDSPGTDGILPTAMPIPVILVRVPPVQTVQPPGGAGSGGRTPVRPEDSAIDSAVLSSEEVLERTFRRRTLGQLGLQVVPALQLALLEVLVDIHAPRY